MINAFFLSIMQVAFYLGLFYFFNPNLQCPPVWVFFCKLWDIHYHKLYSEPFFSHFTSSLSGRSDGGQSCGTDPDEAAGSETVVQGADQLHSLCGAVRGLAVSVAGPGAHALTGRALLSHVLVQLRALQETAVWTLPHQGSYICHLLCFWSFVRFRKSSHPSSVAISVLLFCWAFLPFYWRLW